MKGHINIICLDLLYGCNKVANEKKKHVEGREKGIGFIRNEIYGIMTIYFRNLKNNL